MTNLILYAQVQEPPVEGRHRRTRPYFVTPYDDRGFHRQATVHAQTPGLALLEVLLDRGVDYVTMTPAAHEVYEGLPTVLYQVEVRQS